MFHGSEDQMFPVDPPLLNSYEAPTADVPLQLESYKKKGYSVVISNGQLCECTSEKGVVIMENGTVFSIAITNSNDYGEKRHKNKTTPYKNLINWACLAQM